MLAAFRSMRAELVGILKEAQTAMDKEEEKPAEGSSKSSIPAVVPPALTPREPLPPPGIHPKRVASSGVFTPKRTNAPQVEGGSKGAIERTPVTIGS